MNPPLHDTMRARFSISLADEHDREIIYKMRHEVYARELGQHAENSQERLTDKLDTINVYIVAKAGTEIAGFVSVTPPTDVGYSIDKNFTVCASGAPPTQTSATAGWVARTSSTSRGQT